MSKIEKVITPKFRASFVTIKEARCAPGSTLAKFSIVAIFPKGTDLSQMKAMAQSALAAKWGPDKTKWPKNLRNPIRDGDVEKEGVEGFANSVFVTLSTLQKPGVVDQNNREIVDLDEVYSGCYCIASVNAYAYDKSGNKGVAFGLQNLKKMEDGEALGGSRSKPTDDFGPVEQASGAESAGADDFLS
jgi:hypothetical protein